MKYCIPVLLAALVVFVSCAKSGEPHLPYEKMEQVLLDLQLAEVYSTMVRKDSGRAVNEKNMDSLAVYTREIFAHHRITEQEFEESMRWYEAHPDDLDSVYARITARLTEMGSKYNVQ